MIDRKRLQEIFAAYQLPCGEKQAEEFDRYAGLLAEWNQKINLTAILEPEEICIKHFLDSVLLLSAAEPEAGASLIDVGTGAGFPSVPCKILRPDLRLTLLDSLNKRVRFLQLLSQELGQENVAVHGRAEELGRKAEYREQFDLATARAVAHLRELAEYCLPFVKPGGCFAALKGYEVEEELAQAEKAIRLLGGEVESMKKYDLPQGNRRAIVLIRKISQTPTKYPRLSAKIKKEPLE